MEAMLEALQIINLHVIFLHVMFLIHMPNVCGISLSEFCQQFQSDSLMGS